MFKHVDMSAAMQRLADRKIEEAMRAGMFDRIEGAGQPLDLEPMPAEENARLLWWTIRILRRNDVVPDEVKLRKAIDLATRHAREACDEATLRSRVGEANEMIRRLNTLGVNALQSGVASLDPESEVARWRRRAAS